MSVLGSVCCVGRLVSPMLHVVVTVVTNIMLNALLAILLKVMLYLLLIRIHVNTSHFKIANLVKMVKAEMPYIPYKSTQLIQVVFFLSFFIA